MPKFRQMLASFAVAVPFVLTQVAYADALKDALKQGWTAIGKGNAASATKHFQTAITADEKAAEAYWGMAIAAEIAKANIREVQAWFEKAVALKPSPGLHNDYGRVLFGRHYYNEARVQFEAALKINEKFAPAHRGLAQIGRATGNRTLTLKHLVRLKELGQY